MATSLFSGYMRRYGRLNGRRVPAYRDLVSRLLRIVQRYRAPIAWGPGEIMMIDNTRMMHGQKRLEDAVAAPRHVRTRYGLLSEVAAPGAAAALG